MRNRAMSDPLFDLGQIASVSATVTVMQTEMIDSIRKTTVMKEPTPSTIESIGSCHKAVGDGSTSRRITADANTSIRL